MGIMILLTVSNIIIVPQTITRYLSCLSGKRYTQNELLHLLGELNTKNCMAAAESRIDLIRGNPIMKLKHLFSSTRQSEPIKVPLLYFLN